MTATMSVLGLYQWDNTLFSLLSLPEGLDKDTLVDFILAECSDLEILYPNPEVLKGLIGVWSATEQYTWGKLYATMQLQYNPIDNYDRTETRTLASQAAGNSTDGGTDTVTSADTGTDTVTSADTGTDTTSNNSTDLNQVKAFDTAANTFTDREKDTVNNSGTTTYGKTNTNTANYGKTNTNTARYGHTNNNTYSKNDTENIRAYGNIGVTTTQQMIEQERETAKFNIFQVILDEFKQRFCVLVY